MHVVYNGIDTDFYRPDPGTDVLERIGVDPSRPYVAFVGRITRQKGVPHLLRARPGVRPVAAGGPARRCRRRPELKAETDAAIASSRASRDGVYVVSEMLPREQVRQVLTHALRSCAPRSTSRSGSSTSRRWRAETAVVASRGRRDPRGGPGRETGLLVDYDEADPAGLETGLAEQVNKLAADPALARRLGEAGRARAVDAFAWDAIAQQAVRLYESLR